MNGQVEIQLQAVDGVHHLSGEAWRGLLVRCRPVGGRRWPVRFIVIGADGQSLLDLIVAAVTVAQVADERFDGGQIELDLNTAAGAAAA